MPPIYFQKPEAALKRAEELIKVDKAADALETLHDTIKSRRFKQWTEVHQDIMFKHLELCVLLKKPHVAKDALFQYKALTQQYKPESLQTVIERFIEMTESKTEEAQKTSIEKVEEIDDLDQGDVPETLLLSVVSGAAAKDRMDRTVLAPWLRFLWDSYRNCLELLRNNAQVETLYHKIARQTFQFCAKYQRRTEFRKLCELLRLHLNHIQKHQHLSHVVKLNSQDSLTLMQDTRLHQLDTAIQMELWQEAYKSAEDVHGMMQLSKDKDKKMVKPGSFVNYYDKLALVFWKAGNSLFHAAALMQKYTIYKEMKKSFAAEEAQEQATRVLLATLSIPDGADGPSDLTRHLDIEEQHVSNIRLLSNLLRLPIAPTRAGILKEIARLNLAETASQSAKALYKLLENNFAPLRLSQQVEEQLAIISSTGNQQYVEALRDAAATKSLKQIATIYDSISWKRLQKIIPAFSELELERLIVDVSKHRFVRAQIDHRNECVRFGSADAVIDMEDGEAYRDDAQSDVEDIRAHLEQMYDKLRVTVEGMNADGRQQELVAQVEAHAKKYEITRQSELDRMANRRRKIENYKETSERVKAERTQQVQAEIQKREEAKRAEEMKRLELENLESEKKRKIAEQEEVQRKIRQDQLKKMQNTAIYQAIIKEKGERVFQEMDPEAVLREQRERFDKERQETQKRLQQQEKTFDHHVRALHLEEMTERKAVMHKRLTDAPKAHEEFEKKRIEKAKEERANALQLWDRLQNIRDDCEEWISAVKDNNQEDFAKKINEFDAKLQAVREHRLQERAEMRKKERREKWIRAKADEERRRKEDEERLRQQQADAHRRAGRDAREERPRGHDDSKANADVNWRTSDRPQQQSGRVERERQPMRDRLDQNAPREEKSWRSNMAQAPAPPTGLYSRDGRERPMDGRERPMDGRERPMDGRSSRPPLGYSDETFSRADFGTKRVEAANLPQKQHQGFQHPSESGGVWQRGQVVQKPQEEPSSQPNINNNKPGVFVPSRLRQQQQDGQASSQSPRNMGNDQRDRDNRDRRGFPPNKPNTTGADSSNWRR